MHPPYAVGVAFSDHECIIIVTKESVCIQADSVFLHIPFEKNIREFDVFCRAFLKALEVFRDERTELIWKKQNC